MMLYELIEDLHMVEPLSDTDPAAERVLIRLLRIAPAWRKIEMVAAMNDTVRLLILSGLRQRHPDAEPPELRRRMADIVLGAEMASQAYGPLLPGGRS